MPNGYVCLGLQLKEFYLHSKEGTNSDKNSTMNVLEMSFKS